MEELFSHERSHSALHVSGRGVESATIDGWFDAKNLQNNWHKDTHLKGEKHNMHYLALDEK
jgi:hypothetical protein